MGDDIETRFQVFKLDVLSEAAFEDAQGIWEPLWQMNTRMSDLSVDQREALAERLLLELYEAGLIFFRRQGPWLADGQESGPGPLDRWIVIEAITGRSWRTVPLQDASIWFAATPAGEEFAAANG